MTPKACATNGSLIRTMAVANVTTRPIAACRSETAPRFSPKPQAIASNAKIPSADCNCSMMSPPPSAIMAAPQFKAQCHAELSGLPLTTRRWSVTDRTMSSTMPVGAGALLKHGSFVFFLLSRSLSRFSSQVGAVAIGWQVYDLTGSALILGMVGLVQFLPTALLVFVAGQAADRYQRKRVVQVCQLAEAITALFLAAGAYAGWRTVAEIFVATAVLGTAGAFEIPATAALLPLIAPQGSLQRATALSSGATQVATITGPALGGLAYAFSPGLPYGIMVLFWLTAMLFTGAI